MMSWKTKGPVIIYGRGGPGSKVGGIQGIKNIFRVREGASKNIFP